MNYKIWSAISVALFVLCLFLFYFLYTVEENRTIDELNARQLIHAKQAAKGLEDYINSCVRQFEMLAMNESIFEPAPQGKKLIDAFYEEQKEHLGSVVRVNEKGIIIYAPPVLKLTGKDISYEKHIKDVMRDRKAVVSDIFYAVQGYNAIAVHVPVSDGKKYIGSLGGIIQVENAAKRFLDDIKIGSSGYAWLLSRDGTELYCPVPGHTGKSIYETALEFPSIIETAKKMMAGETGFTTYYYNQIGPRKVKETKKYAVYVPVHIHNTIWSICVSSPEDDVLTSLINFRNKLFIIIIAFFIAGTIFAYYGMKTRGIIKESNARKKAELLLQQLNSELEYQITKRTKELEKINKDLESFNYTVSHDLRTPIRGINSFIQILSDEYADVLDEEANGLIRRIKRAVEKMDVLIESMLKLSRLNYYSLEITEINLSVLARTAAKELQSQYPDVKYEIKIENNMEITGDYGLISLLLENLLSNAFKYSSKTEKPVIEFYRFHKDGKDIYCVKDNGAGFIGEKDEKLFSPFKRYHNDYEFNGIGIGLAIVKKVIDLHNGTIKAESKPGCGAAFYFTVAGT